MVRVHASACRGQAALALPVADSPLDLEGGRGGRVVLPGTGDRGPQQPGGCLVVAATAAVLLWDLGLNMICKPNAGIAMPVSNSLSKTTRRVLLLQAASDCDRTRT